MIAPAKSIYSTERANSKHKIAGMWRVVKEWSENANTIQSLPVCCRSPWMDGRRARLHAHSFRWCWFHITHTNTNSQNMR